MRSTFILAVLAVALAACGEAREVDTRTEPARSAANATADAAADADADATPEKSFGEGKVVLSEKDLRAKLTDEEYRVTQQCGTEPPFTGEYWNTHTPGVYHCVVCGAALFSSDTKFESGSGWPSFFRPVGEGAVKEKEDDSLGMRRIEITCGNCGAHLGHVFPDGPKPTGLRYCINSAALDLVPTKEAKPDEEAGADADVNR